MNRGRSPLRRAGGLLPALLTGGLLLKGLHPSLPGWPCPLRALTGIPCPTCFLTRATAAALTGDLAGAVRLHAFGPLLAAALVAWSLLALRQRRLWPRWPRPLAACGRPAGLLSLTLTLLGYWLLRLNLHHAPELPASLAFPSGG